MRLKNNKAAGPDGLPAELFMAGRDELARSCRIWLEESMPRDWIICALCPILKKEDITICANYRGISLSYKLLTSVLCDRLKPHAKALIGPYQCSFKPGKSTIDQIFTLRQILEKRQNTPTFCRLQGSFPVRDSIAQQGMPQSLSSVSLRS